MHVKSAHSIQDAPILINGISSNHQTKIEENLPCSHHKAKNEKNCNTYLRNDPEVGCGEIIVSPHKSKKKKHKNHFHNNEHEIIEPELLYEENSPSSEHKNKRKKHRVFFHDNEHEINESLSQFDENLAVPQHRSKMKKLGNESNEHEINELQYQSEENLVHLHKKQKKHKQDYDRNEGDSQSQCEKILTCPHKSKKRKHKKDYVSSKYQDESQFQQKEILNPKYKVHAKKNLTDVLHENNEIGFEIEKNLKFHQQKMKTKKRKIHRAEGKNEIIGLDSKHEKNVKSLKHKAGKWKRIIDNDCEINEMQFDENLESSEFENANKEHEKSYDIDEQFGENLAFFQYKTKKKKRRKKYDNEDVSTENGMFQSEESMTSSIPSIEESSNDNNEILNDKSQCLHRGYHKNKSEGIKNEKNLDNNEFLEMRLKLLCSPRQLEIYSTNEVALGKYKNKSRKINDERFDSVLENTMYNNSHYVSKMFEYENIEPLNSLGVKKATSTSHENDGNMIREMCSNSCDPEKQEKRKKRSKSKTSLDQTDIHDSSEMVQEINITQKEKLEKPETLKHNNSKFISEQLLAHNVYSFTKNCQNQPGEDLFNRNAVLESNFDTIHVKKKRKKHKLQLSNSFSNHRAKYEEPHFSASILGTNSTTDNESKDDCGDSPIKKKKRKHNSNLGNSPIKNKHNSNLRNSPIKNKHNSNLGNSPIKKKHNSNLGNSPIKKKHNSNLENSLNNVELVQKSYNITNHESDEASCFDSFENDSSVNKKKKKSRPSNTDSYAIEQVSNTMDTAVTNNIFTASLSAILECEEELPDFDIPPLHQNERVRPLNKNEREKLNKQGIKIKSGRFTKEENAIFQRNWNNFIQKYEVSDPIEMLGINCRGQPRKKLKKFLNAKHFYVKLARDLNNRTLFTVYKHARSTLDPTKDSNKFSSQDMKKLLHLHSVHGNKWALIADIMEKTANQCEVSFRSHRKGQQGGPWTNEEIESLRMAVKLVCKSEEKIKLLSSKRCNTSWQKIANMVKSRNIFQCREQWLYRIAWTSEMQKWGTESKLLLVYVLHKNLVEDETLIDWSAIYRIFKYRIPSYAALIVKWGKIKRTVPNYIQKSHPEIMSYLFDNYVPKLLKTCKLTLNDLLEKSKE